MKSIKTAILLLLLTIGAVSTVKANVPDSVSIFIYNTPSDSHKGLHIAYSVDQKTWYPIGNDRSFVTSDYGPWGSQKMMFNPSVLKDGDTWYAVWQLNEKNNQFATTKTSVLSVWKPQDYPYVTTTDNKPLTVLNPLLTKQHGQFAVTFASKDGKYYQVTSSDFKTWSKATSVTSVKYTHKKCVVNGQTFTGDISTAPWTLIENLINKIDATQVREAKYNESMRDDERRFMNIHDLQANLTIDFAGSKAISNHLIGIFFEDINYAADGGLYAELIQNRDFEYTNKDNGNWNSKSFWKTEGEGSFNIATDNPIHKNNSHYAILSGGKGTKLVNEGFDGICVKAGEKYNLAAFLRSENGQHPTVYLREGDKIIAKTSLSSSKDWKQQKAVLAVKETSTKAELVIELSKEGSLDIDFVSLFPQNTFKGRKNGMRTDLAQTLADMQPKFVRFPGGCLSHGNGLNNMYHWKNTIGPLWERKGDFNIWHYHQSLGLGFYEYFQFCEDIGAEPLPVLPAGVPCQNSSVGGMGQQGGLPFKANATDDSVMTMEEYLQELLDLIEWANGDPKTSKWAKMRADAGHEKPFNLKMLGVGNEDLISDVFEERFTFLKNGIKAKYPDINIVGTAGPFFEGSDYEYGWQIAKKENVEIVDEHYYVNPGWYIYNQQFYDKYERKGPQVYLGEWASRSNRLENALVEALHITNLERNADIVTMSSYAPLFGREGHCQWNPDLIYFNGSEVHPAPSYYTQMLAGRNSGTEYIPSTITFVGTDGKDAPQSEGVTLRVNSSVVKAENGDLIIKLVNLLPQTVTMKLNLAGFDNFNKEAQLSVLSGNPTDSKAAPKNSTLTVGEQTTYELPAHSFSVIRITR